jgi:hypothetical protein
MKIDWLYKLLRLVYVKIDAFSHTLQRRRAWGLAVNLALIVIVLGVVADYLFNQWSTLQNIGISLNPVPFLYSIGLYGLNYFLFVLAWSLLIKVFSGAYSLQENALIYSYSQLAKLLPTPAWFIAGRVVMYNKEGISKRSVLIATGLETAFHAWIGFAIFCVLSIQISQPLTWLYGLGTVATVFILKVFISIKSTQIQIQETLRLKNALVLFFIFILTWLTSAPFLAWTIQGISGQPLIPILEIWKIWIISSIFSYIGTYTLGGIGVVREFSLVFLLGKYFPPPVCLVIAVMSRIIIMVGNLVWPGILIGLIKVRQAVDQAGKKRLKRPD